MGESHVEASPINGTATCITNYTLSNGEGGTASAFNTTLNRVRLLHKPRPVNDTATCNANYTLSIGEGGIAPAINTTVNGVRHKATWAFNERPVTTPAFANHIYR
ncbi:hypothetical protein [Mucilaginibacter hurinus]|uniref:hypothetical protein n=1 Tax=Mucilaginibacter hurinus TaxID=2201324 RepID=UPI0013147C04|nr:hypothetical protein [Mucilaginibacter hurinus]